MRAEVSFNAPKNYTGIVLKYGEGAAGTVAQSGQALLIDDYSTWPGRADAFADEKSLKAICSAPMLWDGQVTGVIHVLRSSGDKTFTQADLELLTLFANHAAIAVENTRLLQQFKLELAERKQANEALLAAEGKLSENEEIFSKAFYAHATAMQIIDLDSAKRVDLNKNFLEITGYTRED